METLVPLFTFALVSTGTPGPNNVMVTASGANFGYRRSLPHVLGITIGFPLMILAIGLGLGLVFERYPLLHQIMAAMGVSYLLYLAWRIATAGKGNGDDKPSRPLTFFEAALFQWINPKAWVLSLGSLAAFTQAGPEFFFQVLLVVGAFVAVSFPCVSLWAMFGVGIGRLLNSQTHLRIFNISMGVLLAASVVPVILRLVEDLAK